MQYIFGGGLIVVGSIMIGLAFHNKVADAWKVIQGAE